MMGLSIPESLAINAVGTAVLAAFGIALLVSLFLALAEAMLRSQNYFKSLIAIVIPLFGFSLPISIIAYVSGFLTTASRTSAVGNVIPAALALIGGLNIYVFGTDNKYKVLIAYCVSLFAIMLFYGAEHGAYLREAGRVFRFEELARQELQIRATRENLGLPKDVPAWLISSEPK